MEKHLTEQESLSLIESMIQRAKNNFSESGTLYLVWGVTIFTCSLFQFIAIKYYHYSNAFYVWFLTWLVLIYQVIFLVKKHKKLTVRTYTDDILKYVWLCFTVCTFLMIFILQSQKPYTSIYPAILVLYAIPTFLSGMVLKVKPLTLGGTCCWALAVFSVFTAYEYQILFIAAAVLVAWIIPGIYLRKKYLKQNSYNGR